MPSGLTCDIYDGTDMTIRGFALKCATQVGAGYFATEQCSKKMPRDKAPVLKVSNYYEDSLRKAQKDLEYWKSLRNNMEAAKDLYEKEKVKSKEKYEAMVKRNEELLQRYNDMLARVSTWDVGVEYSSLRDIMVKQLMESIEFDCRPIKPFVYPSLSTEEWVDEHIKEIEREIVYFTEKHQKEEERVSEINAYLQGLYKAIDKVEPLT